MNRPSTRPTAGTPRPTRTRARQTPTFALLRERRRLIVRDPENGARFTIPLRDWQELLRAIRVDHDLDPQKGDDFGFSAISTAMNPEDRQRHSTNSYHRLVDATGICYVVDLSSDARFWAEDPGAQVEEI